MNFKYASFIAGILGLNLLRLSEKISLLSLNLKDRRRIFPPPQPHVITRHRIISRCLQLFPNVGFFPLEQQPFGLGQDSYDE